MQAARRRTEARRGEAVALVEAVQQAVIELRGLRHDDGDVTVLVQQIATTVEELRRLLGEEGEVATPARPKATPQAIDLRTSDTLQT
jgi:hypothetical protein